jgi:hypothetical protein
MQALKSHEHFSKIASETQEVISKEVEVCLVYNREIDFKDNYITPWKVIQGYLECLLHLGVMYERMGHGFDAKRFLLEGLNIYDTFHFPLLYLFFSFHIGTDVLFTRFICFSYTQSDVELILLLFMCANVQKNYMQEDLMM